MQSIFTPAAGLPKLTSALSRTYLRNLRFGGRINCVLAVSATASGNLPAGAAAGPLLAARRAHDVPLGNGPNPIWGSHMRAASVRFIAVGAGCTRRADCKIEQPVIGLQAIGKKGNIMFRLLEAVTLWEAGAAN